MIFCSPNGGTRRQGERHTMLRIMVIRPVHQPITADAVPCGCGGSRSHGYVRMRQEDRKFGPFYSVEAGSDLVEALAEGAVINAETDAYIRRQLEVFHMPDLRIDSDERAKKQVALQVQIAEGLALMRRIAAGFDRSGSWSGSGRF